MSILPYSSPIVKLNALRNTLLILLLLSSCGLHAQLVAPVAHCASVNLDGSVQLTWTPPMGVDPATTYRVYRDSGGGFQLINTVGPSNATGYLDGLIDATVSSISYYITTNFTNESAPSNTIATIYLEVNALNLSSVAQLTWNSTGAAPAGIFEVDRQIATDGWVLIASLPVTSVALLDTLHGLCVPPNEDPIAVGYRIRQVLPQCTSSSQVAGDFFQDLLGPAPPQVETVLINPITGFAEIYWFPSSAPDLDKYIIQSITQQTGGQISLNVGSVQNGLPTAFIYEDAAPNNSNNLVVIAFDSCGNDNSYLGIFTTMFLKTIYTNCSQNAQLSWNGYQGWTEGIDRYNLYAQVDGAPFEIVAEIETDATTFEFEVIPNTEYCFYIEALSNGIQRPSTSNVACFTTTYPNVVDFAYLSSVNTLESGAIEVNLYQDIEGVGTTYELMRSSDGSDFQPIASLNQSVEEFVPFVDLDANGAEEQYTYKWVVFDGCGQEIFESNTGRNVLLSAAGGSEAAMNALEWSSYLTWENGVAEYQVERRLGLDGEFQPFAVLGPQSFSFVDDVNAFIEDEGFFCYKIIALENTNSFGFSSKAASNEECVSLPPLMWIPSAIVVNGFNSIFKPVAGFIDFDSFEMEIRNRWGQLLFESQSIDDGWNGTFDGKRVREDQYQYVIRYRDGAGQLYIRQGAVVVLHEVN